jgi:hypothetical protein
LNRPWATSERTGKAASGSGQASAAAGVWRPITACVGVLGERRGNICSAGDQAGAIRRWTLKY